MDDKQQMLKAINDAVKGAVPEAEETISYGMPAFRYKGKILCYYEKFKDHVSLFPTSSPIEHFQKELLGYKVSKGTVQFALGTPVPTDLVKRMVLFKKAEIDDNK